MLEVVDQKIKIEVNQTYVAEQSDPNRSLFFFSYEIGIANHSDEPVQLLRRRWLIEDSSGRVEEVEGEGVVGLQPIIEPGEKFVYTSFCPLTTPTGSMRGTYEMQSVDKTLFKVQIPMFVLAEPSYFH